MSDAGEGPFRSVLEQCRHLPVRTFAAGEPVLVEGTREGVLYVLASGSLDIMKGDILINSVTEPGALVGEVAALLDLPHTATVRAREACTVHVAEDPEAFLHSNPAIAFELARLLARRLHFVSTYLVDVKRQFAEHDDHLGIVDEVLETLVHHQEPHASAGSDRCPDPDPTTE